MRGTCEVASAGHLPPLLVCPDGSSQCLDVPLAPPLGVCETLITSQTFDIEDGSLMVLDTDGLARLQAGFSPATASRSVDELCKAALAGAYADHQRDDIAVLIARLSRLKHSQQACWVLPNELTSAGQARMLVKEPPERWNLADLLPTTQLLVSELVTNAIRYTPEQVTLRLIQEGTLVCEVSIAPPPYPGSGMRTATMRAAAACRSSAAVPPLGSATGCGWQDRLVPAASTPLS